MSSCKCGDIKKHPSRNIGTIVEFARRLSFDYGDKNGKAILQETPPGGRDPASQRLSILSVQSTKIEKRWNVFRSIPRDQEPIQPRWTLLSAQCLKLAAYLIMHAIVCGSGIVAKTALLLMISNMRSADRTYVPCRPYGYKKALIPQDRQPLPPNSVGWFYWYIWLAMCFPQILLFIRSIRVVAFKFVPSPSIRLVFVAFFLETAQTIGVCLLIFAVLPGLDAVRASMLLAALAVVPSFLRCLRHFDRESLTSKRLALVLIDVLVMLCQSSALWIWPIFDSFHPSELGSRLLLPFALLLSSLTFWENYVDRTNCPQTLTRLARLRDQLQRVRYKIQIGMTLWKCVLSLFLMIVCGGARHSVSTLFDLSIPFTQSNDTSNNHGTTNAMELEHAQHVWLLFLTMVFSTLICFQCARFACKVRMDRFSYALPTVVVLPMTTILLLSFCEARRHQLCYFASWIPDRLFWRCDYENPTDGLFVKKSSWAWILWLVSYIWMVRHIFAGATGRLNKTDTILINPIYEGLLVDHSLALNRRRRKTRRIRRRDLDDDLNEESAATEGTEASLACSMTSLSLLNSHADSMTKIYICATMWHETRNEMIQTLKSVMRMDEDQSARRNAQKYLKVVDKDYYELEAHVFFDDAWTDDDKLGCRVPNEFVETFVGAVDDAASSVHNVHMKLRAPIKLDVPYGGRLVWTLPGDNRLFVHLKDKQKIRNKKRWSQVMYMYYLLGHRVMELISDVNRKQLLADNTFILTIDGDSKFTPSAVQKLVDLMRKDSRLGSACGRIHPIGTGIMVWYQKFEYAIAHWFQKAAEHVFGCVLCSPGCFSMFRGSALMDDNVMNKYTKLAAEPRHFVQYDQGEDRWLSTLLLKQGYRIEYAAAADAETHAPEGFNEFFNQRRRWTPSSTANTLDLLYDFRRAVRNNDSLSRFYIFYQMLVILFSLLSPAIIFTMMVFAQVATLPVNSSTVLWSNISLVLSYCITCFVASSKAQLIYAKLLSIVYAFIMMAVLVGTGIQITTEGADSPISIFVLSLASVFFIAAFFHPHEFTNIFYGAVFFLMIPCTYVLLSLYALVNLNVINWGTREAAEKATGRASETKWQQWIRRFRPGGKKGHADDQKTYPNDPKVECGCPSLCMCLLCPDERRTTTGVALKRGSRRDDERFIWLGDHLERVDRRVERVEARVDDIGKRRSLIVPTSMVLSSPPMLGDGDQEMVDLKAASPSRVTNTDKSINISASTSNAVKRNDGMDILSTIQTHGKETEESHSEVLRRFASLPEICVTAPTPVRGRLPLHRSLTESHIDMAPQMQEQRSEEAISIEEMKAIDAGRYTYGYGFTGRTSSAASLDSHSSVYSMVSQNVDTDNEVAESDGPLCDMEGEVVEVGSGNRGYGEPESRSDCFTPKWMNLPYIKKGTNDILDEIENQFWNDLIETYLKPIDKDPEEETRNAEKLRGLRNNIAFGLLLVNALLVLTIYLLQMHKDLLSIEWPGGNRTVIKRDPQSGAYVEMEGPLKIEPIGFTIIMFLSLILVIQTFGMIIHRWQTLQHTLASTVLPCFKRTRPREYNGEELLEENAVEIAKRLQRLRGEEDGSGDKRRRKVGTIPGPSSTAVQVRRRVVFNLERARKHKPKTRGLHAAFQKRFFNFNPDKQRDSLRGIRLEKDNVLFQSDSAKKAAARALKKRRDSLIVDSVQRSGSFVREDDVAACLDQQMNSVTSSRKKVQSCQKEHVKLEPTRLDFGTAQVGEDIIVTGDGSPVLRRPQDPTITVQPRPNSSSTAPKCVSFSDEHIYDL